MTNRAHDLPYFEVCRALQTQGCALCTLILDGNRRYVERILAESVNDPGVRASWRKGGGVCRRHAEYLEESGDALAVGILYLDLLGEKPDQALGHPAGAPCMVCLDEQRRRERHWRVLRVSAGDPDLIATADTSEGLCGPHLRQARVELRGTTILGHLEAATVRGLVRTRKQLAELVSSFDYRNPAPGADASRSWRAVINRYLGIAGAIEETSE
jgi:hypothetical protein